MKRDMDIIRRIILETAELPYGETLESLEGISEEAFITHVIWLQEAGLIEADAQAGSGSFAQYAIVFRLTWDGCEFSDAIQDDTLWNKAKEVVLKPGLSFTFDTLKEWLKAEIKNGLPSLRSLSG
jgi:hypothetical protein